MSVENIKSEKLRTAIIKMQVSAKMNYYGYFACYFTFIEDNTMGAAAGVTIKNRNLIFMYNSIIIDDMVEKLGEKFLYFLVIHECQHILLAHISRTGDRDHAISNIVQDMIINFGIKQDYGISYDKFFYADKVYNGNPIKFDPAEYAKIKGLIMFEPMYNYIFEQTEFQSGSGEGDEDGEGQGQGSGSGGQGNENGKGKSKGKSEGELVDDHIMNKESEEGTLSSSEISQMEGIVRGIHEQIKSQGFNPGQTITDNFNYKRGKQLVNVFKKVLGNGTDKQRTYRHMSRRCDNLKGNRKDSKDINIILDTSGSLYNELDEYIGQVVGKFASYIVQCDTRVAWHGAVKDMSGWKKIKKAGGGGTILQPAIDKLIELKRADYPLYFVSDFYCDHLDLSKYKGPIVFIKTKQSIDPVYSGSKKVRVVSSEKN